MYEYKFVRLGQGLIAAKREAEDQYQDVVREHARQGWRLVQVFAPPIGSAGRALFFELIFERAAPARP